MAAPSCDWCTYVWRQWGRELSLVLAGPGGLPAASQGPKGITRTLINLATHSRIADNGTPLSPWQMACLGLSKPSSHCLGLGFDAGTFAPLPSFCARD